MKLITIKNLSISLLSVGILWVCLGSFSQAKDKPQEAMDRIRTFSIEILENTDGLSFRVIEPYDWTYAKITATNKYTSDENSISITPKEDSVLKIYESGQYWIEANIKETEVRRLAIGQKVHVSVDAYPDERFEGSIERIGNTATSAFALLPSPNPSGNFTKITQRLPVRIAIEQRGGRLRPGMMVEIKIVTGG